MKKPAMAIALALALSACGGSSSGSSDENPTVEPQPTMPDTSSGGDTSSSASGADGELKNHDQVLFNTSHTAKLDGTQLTLKYLPEPGQGTLAIIDSDDVEMTLYVSSANSASETGFAEALKELKNPQQRWIYIPENSVTEVELTVESSQENSEFTFTLARPSRKLLNMSESDLFLNIVGNRSAACDKYQDLHGKLVGMSWPLLTQAIINFSNGYKLDSSGSRKQLKKTNENTFSENIEMEFKYMAYPDQHMLTTKVEVEYVYDDHTGETQIGATKRRIPHQGQYCRVNYSNDYHKYPIVEVVD